MVTNSPSVNLNKVFEGNKTVVVADKATHFRLKMNKVHGNQYCPKKEGKVETGGPDSTWPLEAGSIQAAMLHQYVGCWTKPLDILYVVLFSNPQGPSSDLTL